MNYKKKLYLLYFLKLFRYETVYLYFFIIQLLWQVRREIWTIIILYSKWDQIIQLRGVRNAKLYSTSRSIIHYSYIRIGISPLWPMKEFTCAASNKRNTKVFQRERYRAAYNCILFAGKFQYWHDLSHQKY